MNYIRTTILTFISLLLVTFSYGQSTYGNEWINFSQTYYKVKVFNNGIHRITKNNLQVCGVNLTNTNTLQLFKNGVEQPIYIHTDNSGVEYIEFYGEKNDGSFDVQLYNTPSDQLNPYYSLYSDTSVYFLTNGSSSGLRYDNVNSNLVNLPVKESSFTKEDIISFNQTWDGGTKYPFAGQNFYKSFYETGEGWGFGENTQFNYSHTLSTSITNQLIEVEMNVSYIGSVLHTPIITINGVQQFNELYNGQTTKTIRFTTQINSNILNITLSGSGEKYNVGYVKVRYSKDYSFDNNLTYRFDLVSNNQRKFLEITNFKNTNNTQEIYLYDLTSKKRIHCFWANSKVLTDLSPSSQIKKLVLVNSDDENSYYNVSKMDEVRFTDYTNYNGDLLIIKHNKIQHYGGRDLIVEYAAHKSSLGFNPVVIDIEEVINQFGYGINNHPQSLRNLFKFTQDNWDNLEYVFLIGKGRVYNEVRGFNTYDNMIPTFGQPASDNLLFSPNGTLSQSVSIGRLSVSNSAEFKSYFDKLVEMEKSKPASWKKKIIHISGGSNQNEKILFKNVLLNLGQLASDVDYNLVSFSENNNLYNEINSGSILMTYLGHGNPLSIETEGDSLEIYTNKSKYPFFISMACKNGGYFLQGDQMSEKFVLAENKGFIGYLGFTTDVSLFGANAISTEIYNQLGDINIGIGEIIKNSIDRLKLSSNGNIVLETAIHALVLHGDPTYVINKGNSFDVNVEPTQQPVDNETILNENIKEEISLPTSTFEPKISNYPNPVSDNTTFEVTLDETYVNISIQIFDIKGQLIKRLNNDFFTTTDNGKFVSERWNVTDELGRELSSGVYFYNIQATDKFGNVKSFSPKSNIQIVK